MNRARLAPECTQVATRINDRIRASASSQRVNRLIYSKPFGDAAEVDEHRSLEHHTLRRKQLERAPIRAGRQGTFRARQQTKLDQGRSNRDIEHTTADLCDVHSAAQHGVRPCVYGHRFMSRV